MPLPHPPDPSPDLAAWLDELVPLLHRAGEAALTYFRRPLAVHDKGGRGFDPVTQADREVEALLRAALHARYPADRVFGEEQGDDGPPSARRCWLVDPIDGTRAFITGVPLWGILLGLLEDGRPVLGCMYQPYTGELFVGNGRESWLLRGGRRQRLQASGVTELAAASLYTTHPGCFGSEADADTYRLLAGKCRLDRYGGDCYSYCMLAAGQIDLVLESGLRPWDVLPLLPIVEGAGGVASDWAGGPVSGSAVLAAATPALQQAVLAALAGRPMPG